MVETIVNFFFIIMICKIPYIYYKIPYMQRKFQVARKYKFPFRVTLTLVL